LLHSLEFCSWLKYSLALFSLSSLVFCTSWSENKLWMILCVNCSFWINSQSLCDDQKDDRVVQNISSPDDIRYITLANQCAADLLLEVGLISNIKAL
jgi:hypothetical protein